MRWRERDLHEKVEARDGKKRLAFTISLEKTVDMTLNEVSFRCLIFLSIRDALRGSN